MKRALTADCPLCRGASPQPFFRKRDTQYWRCHECGHVFVFPLPGKEDTARHYQDSYTTGYLEHIRPWFEVLARRRMEVLERFCVPPSRGRLLDAGSGYGIFLAEARARGWSTLGIEASAEAADFARRELGLDVASGDLMEVLPRLPEQSFDVVSFWHVLEHVDRPAEVLEAATACLKAGGLLVINSPNLGSAVFGLVGSWWTWIYTPGHLQYFSCRPLSRWLEEREFSVELRETWTDAPTLYFLLLEALAMRATDALSRVPGLLARRMAAALSRPFSDHVRHTLLQQRLGRLYYATPGLDRFLARRLLGHEFLIVARNDRHFAARRDVIHNGSP